MRFKTNIERAKLQEVVFWLFGVWAICCFIFDLNFVTGEITLLMDDFTPRHLSLVVFMFLFHTEAIRSLKREIADLKSGDGDVSTATQDSE